MTSVDSAQVDRRFLANSMASFIQIGAVVVLILWCYKIVAPFLNVVIWGLIISVALYPVHVRLTARDGEVHWSRATVPASYVIGSIVSFWMIGRIAGFWA